jgi:hypothetical protein
MIIFFENGRLGNQLFQYCALRKLQENGALYLIGMQTLKSMFENVETAGVTCFERIIERLISFLGIEVVGGLAKILRIIGTINAQIEQAGSKIVWENGLFRNIYFCDTSFFQSEESVEESVAGKLLLKPQLLTQASNIVKNYPHDRTQTFFVHIRRGDYVYWPSKSHPAVLPLNWYMEQMDQIRSKYAKPFFVVVSDDGPYADEMFAMYKDVFVAHESEDVDFALMSLCDGGGILSASSFSWWAAYFARLNGAGYFVAPLYWTGHRRGDWLPVGIKTSWLKYAAVS